MKLLDEGAQVDGVAVGNVKNLPASSGNHTAVDLSKSNNFSLPTLTENTTLDAPSSGTSGQDIVIFGTQHASAAKTVSYNAAWVWVDGVTPSVPTTVGAKFTIVGKVRPDGNVACSMFKFGVS